MKTKKIRTTTSSITNNNTTFNININTNNANMNIDKNSTTTLTPTHDPMMLNPSPELIADNTADAETNDIMKNYITENTQWSYTNQQVNFLVILFLLDLNRPSSLKVINNID